MCLVPDVKPRAPTRATRPTQTSALALRRDYCGFVGCIAAFHHPALHRWGRSAAQATAGHAILVS